MTQLLSDEYFVCPDCSCHYEWRAGVTGLFVDKERRCVVCGLKEIATVYDSWDWKSLLNRIRVFFNVEVFPSTNPEMLQFVIHAGGPPITKSAQVAGDTDAKFNLSKIVHDLIEVDYPIQFTALPKLRVPPKHDDLKLGLFFLGVIGIPTGIILLILKIFGAI